MTFIYPKNLSEREAREMEVLADQLMRTGTMDLQKHEGTYDCRVCGKDVPHDHALRLSDLTDTDKLLRHVAAEGERFQLFLVDSGWGASIFRAGMSARSREVVIAPFRGDRTIGTSKHGTAHLALRALAKLVDEDTAGHRTQVPRRDAE